MVRRATNLKSLTSISNGNRELFINEFTLDTTVFISVENEKKRSVPKIGFVKYSE